MLLLVFSLSLAGCSGNEGIFEITDVSKAYTFLDSSDTNADCCLDLLVTGELDGPAWIHVQYYYPNIRHGMDSIYLPKGIIDSISTRHDYFGKKIGIKYFPGNAKKGNLRIRTQVL